MIEEIGEEIVLAMVFVDVTSNSNKAWNVKYSMPYLSGSFLIVQNEVELGYFFSFYDVHCTSFWLAEPPYRQLIQMLDSFHLVK
jgi:hypothetical protein